MIPCTVTHQVWPTMIPRIQTLVSSPWTGSAIILALAALVVIVSINRKQYELKLKSLLTNRSRTMTYDIEQTERWANVLLWIVVTGSFALSATVIAQHAETAISWFGFATLFALIGTYLCLKFAIMKFVGYVFHIKEMADDFINSVYVTTAIVGCITFFLGIGMAYSSEAWWSALTALTLTFGIIALIIISFKAIQIFYHGLSTLFYVFLYLCTLEILPVTVIVKLTTSYIFV